MIGVSVSLLSGGSSMKRYILFLILFGSVGSQAQDTFWTYYDVWCMGNIGQWNINTTWIMPTKLFAANAGNITHVVIFPGTENVRSDFSPYFTLCQQYSAKGGATTDSIDFLWNGVNNPRGGYSSWVSDGGIEALRDSLHAKGRKILVCLNAVNAAAGLNFVLADSARIETFTRAVSGYLDRHDFDGCDLNVENSQTYTNAQLTQFFRIMKRNLSPGKLLTTVPPVTSWGEYVASIPYLDYVLPQCYNYFFGWNRMRSCNAAFLIAPLRKTPSCSFFGNNLQDVTSWGPNQWYNAGFPRNKIVMLLTTNAMLMRGISAQCECVGSTAWLADTAARRMTEFGGTLHWDDAHVGAYVAGTATHTVSGGGSTINAGEQFYIPIMADRNLDSIVTGWAKPQGFMNFGFFDVALDSRPNEMIKMPRHAYLGSLLRTRR